MIVMPFYATRSSADYRFGDVIHGLPSATPRVPPSSSPGDRDKPWTVDVIVPRFHVMMTPCCSIKSGRVLVVPLERLTSAQLRNEYLREDLLRFNYPVPGDKSLPAAGWNKLNVEEQAVRSAQSPAYVLYDLFVYADHALLPEYEVKHGTSLLTLGHYCIQFKMMHRLDSPLFDRNTGGTRELKTLELTTDARSSLRDKLNKFFSRVPEEDLVTERE